MKNNKLYARIAPPDYIDMESYFDIVEESAQGHLIVIGNPHYCSDYKSNDWKCIEEVIDTVSYYLENLVPYESPAFYKRFSDVLSDYLPGWENGKKRSGTLIHNWKEAVRKYDENGHEDETACAAFNIHPVRKGLAVPTVAVKHGEETVLEPCLAVGAVSRCLDVENAIVGEEKAVSLVTEGMAVLHAD